MASLSCRSSTFLAGRRHEFRGGDDPPALVIPVDGFCSVASGRLAVVEHNFELVWNVGNWASGPFGQPGLGINMCLFRFV